MNKRPIPVTILGYLLIAAGAMGIAYHFGEFNASRPGEYVWVLIVRLIAIVCGVFVLRGKNWARWLSIAWIAFHVILSLFHSMGEAAVHALFLTVFAVLLFLPAANQFFRAHAPNGE